jgi:acetoin utilization protein AcuB
MPGVRPITPKAMTNAPLRVEQVMTRQVITLTRDHSVQEAITLVVRNALHHLVVVNTAGHLVGVLSDRDLLRSMIRQTNAASVTLEELLAHEPIVINAEAPLSQAINLLLTHRIHCLPVQAEEGHVVGVITSTDLLRAFQSVLEGVEVGPAR